MKYKVHKSIYAYYHEGVKYPVFNGVIQIPGKQIEGLVPVVEKKKKD